MSAVLAIVASLLLAAPHSGGGGTESPQAVLDAMIRDNVELRAGEGGDAGKFVIVLVKLASPDAGGFAKSRQRAMQRIGEYLGAQISSDVKSQVTESSDAAGKALSSSFFSDTSRVEVDRSLAGIEGFKTLEVAGNPSVAFMLSQSGVRRCDALSEAARVRDRSGPVIVEAMGLATVVGRVEDARDKAIESAKRTAVEMALGATIVGMTFADTREDDSKITRGFRDTSLSASSGFIDGYEQLDEGRGPSETYFVRIRARIVAEKIFDSYQAHLEAMGNPVFVIEAGGDRPLAERMTQFFTEKGFRIAEDAIEPDWRIVAKASYTEREHPTDGKSGVQCQLTLKLVNAGTGDVASGLSTDGKASDFLSGGIDAQKRRAVETAFKKCAPDIHKAINDSIVRMAREGRPVRIRIGGLDASRLGIDASTPSALQQRLEKLPGLRNPQVGVSNTWLTVELKSLVPSDLLGQLVASEACALVPNSRERLTRVAPNEIDIYLDPR